jgi:hypothetical protein
MYNGLFRISASFPVRLDGSMATVTVTMRDFARLSEFTLNTKWLLENMKELREKYPDRYLAVCDSGKSILDASTSGELKEKILQAGKDPSVCAIDFITREEYILIV